MNDIHILFDTFFNGRGIGFDRLFNRVNHINPTNFPPHNIVKQGENDLVVSLAVAGYTEDNIKISVEDRILNITGEIPHVDDLEYIHHPIASRKFTKSFALDEHLEVVGAAMKTGLLHVRLHRSIPEEKKPKLIPIMTDYTDIGKLLE